MECPLIQTEAYKRQECGSAVIFELLQSDDGLPWGKLEMRNQYSTKKSLTILDNPCVVNSCLIPLDRRDCRARLHTRYDLL
jgi:hypothetical protein